MTQSVHGRGSRERSKQTHLTVAHLLTHVKTVPTRKIASVHIALRLASEARHRAFSLEEKI